MPSVKLSYFEYSEVGINTYGFAVTTMNSPILVAKLVCCSSNAASVHNPYLCLSSMAVTYSVIMLASSDVEFEMEEEVFASLKQVVSIPAKKPYQSISYKLSSQVLSATKDHSQRYT